MNTGGHRLGRKLWPACGETALLGIRNSPFSRHEDIPTFMVSFLAREAEAEGKPLTEQEMKLLGAPAKQGGLTPEFKARVEGLIRRVVGKNEPRSTQDPRTFLTGMEWAEMEDAHVVSLTEALLIQGTK